MVSRPLKARKYYKLGTQGSMAPQVTTLSSTIVQHTSLSEKTKDEPQKLSGGSTNQTSLRHKYLPADKRCLVTRVLKRDQDVILSQEALLVLKRTAETSVNPPKTFLQELYGSEKYVLRFGKKKRGSKAVNWRISECGEFLCPSLHDANNIYEALGKKKWNLNQNKKQYLAANDDVRCSFILSTRHGQTCSKKKCINSQYCTLHHRKLTMGRVA